MDLPCFDRLADHLVPRGYRDSGDLVVRRILADPQEHIDALVDAGVLSMSGGYGQTDIYRVVQPHVHEWRVSYPTTVVNPGDTVILRCGCGDKYNVPNRLPLEAPDA